MTTEGITPLRQRMIEDMRGSMRSVSTCEEATARPPITYSRRPFSGRGIQTGAGGLVDASRYSPSECKNRDRELRA